MRAKAEWLEKQADKGRAAFANFAKPCGLEISQSLGFCVINCQCDLLRALSIYIFKRLFQFSCCIIAAIFYVNNLLILLLSLKHFLKARCII
jgi:hypothetical protein